MQQQPLPPQAALISALSDELIPWVSDHGAGRLILTQQPWHVPSGVEMTHRPAPILANTGEGRSHLFLNRWREEGMHAIRFPYLCCVLEGEIDLRIGTRMRGKQAIASLKGNGNYRILSLPKQTFLLILPGVPYPAGGLHWQRPHLPPSNSRILWMQLLPSGPCCHLSTTQQSSYTSYPSFVVPDPEIAILTTLLIEELRVRSEEFEAVAKNLFLALLLRVRRGLRRRFPIPTRFYQQLKPFTARGAASQADQSVAERGMRDAISPANADLLERARAYIQAHHNEALTLEHIARQVHTSRTQLIRLFRLEQGTTVMKYLAHCRLEMAKSLLENTKLTSAEVGWLVGYHDPKHFCRVFKQQHHLAPIEYRNRCLPIIEADR